MRLYSTTDSSCGRWSHLLKSSVLGLSPWTSRPQHLLPGSWDWHPSMLYLAKTSCPSGHFISCDEQASGLPDSSAGRFRHLPGDSQP